jgi:hypothetical protein
MPVTQTFPRSDAGGDGGTGDRVQPPESGGSGVPKMAGTALRRLSWSADTRSGSWRHCKPWSAGFWR